MPQGVYCLNSSLKTELFKRYASLILQTFNREVDMLPAAFPVEVPFFSSLEILSDLNLEDDRIEWMRGTSSSSSSSCFSSSCTSSWSDALIDSSSSLVLCSSKSLFPCKLCFLRGRPLRLVEFPSFSSTIAQYRKLK